MKLQEVTAYEFKSQAILNESWQQLTESQRIYVGRWEKNVWPLMEQVTRLYEAELTQNQINTIFANAETVAGKDGGNLTALGKAGKVTSEVSKKLQAEIDKLLNAAQNSGPIKNFDQQFEKLKAQLKQKLEGNPMGQKILKAVDGYAGFAKENPAKAAFVIGAMTSILAFASGGIASGATIGFFLKLASNTLKGDKLSTAVGKSVKGAAIGAAAGALGDALDKLLPPEITNTFINDASGEIDIAALDGMDATSLTDLDPEAAKELIQTRGAMAELMRSTDLDAEAKEVLQGQLKQVDDKIFALAGEDGGNLNQAIDKMQGEFDIKGTDVDIEKTTDVSGDGIEDATDTEVVAKLDADDLNDAGINSADYPDNAWITENTQKLLDAGLTEEDIEALQNAQGFERAVAQKEWMGTNISASDKIVVGDDIQVDGVPEDIKVGQTWKSTISKTLPDGTEYSGTVESMIEGVDADGNPVYQIKSVNVQPNAFTENLDKALDNLPPELADELYDKVFGTVSGSMETAVDDMAQNIVKAAAAVGLGGALAGMEVKPEDKKEPAKESIDYAEAYSELFEEYKQQQLDEIDIAGIAKKGAKAVGGALGKGLDKAGAAAQAGIGKAVKGVKDVGRQVGLKVTKEKLAKAHKAAGSPTDTASIVNILADNGLSEEQIGAIGQESKVELPAPTSTKAKDPAQDTPAQAGGDAKADAPAQAGTPAQAQSGTPAQGKAVQKGTKMKAKDGNEYEWKGALWVNTATNKPIGIIPSMQQGLPNPKLDPIISAAKKDPAMAKAIKAQISAKGVEPGTAGAQKAAQAGVKGTEPLAAQGVGA